MKTVDPTKIPAIPVVPGQITPEMAKYLTSLAEALEVRLGRKGDERDRAVTVRELIAAGLVDETFSDTFDLNTVTSTSLGIKPAGDSNTTTIMPVTPTGLTASALYRKVLLEWDRPSYTGHSFTEIFRSDDDVLGNAVFINLTTGRTAVDEVGATGATYYYWIRFVSSTGDVGPFNSASGTEAVTVNDVTFLLNVLEGEILAESLTTTLQSEIDLISGTGAGSVSARIATEASNRALAISDAISDEVEDRNEAIATARSALQSQLNDLQLIDAYDNTTTYSQNDQATYNDVLYKYINATAASGNLPTDTTYWEALGDYTSLADLASANSAAITQINTVDSTSTSTAAKRIASLNTEFGLVAPYNPLTQYVDGNKVSYQNNVYEADATTTGNLPTDTTYWTLTTENQFAKIDSYDAVETAVTDTTTGLTAQGTKISGIETALDLENGTFGKITTLDSLNTSITDNNTGLTAQGTKISGIETALDLQNGTFGKITTLDSLNTSITDSNTGLTAQGNKIGSIETALDLQNGTFGKITTLDSLNTSVTHTDTGLSAQGTKISALESNLDIVADYDANTAYTIGQKVLVGGTVYIAKGNTQGNTPPNATFWDVSTLSALGKVNLIDSVDATVSDTSTGLSAQGTKISTMETNLGLVADYDNAEQYDTNEKVLFSGVVYKAKGTTQGNTPPNTTFWEATTENRFGNVNTLNSLNALVTDSDEGLEATLEKVETLESSLGLADGSFAKIDLIDTLDSTVTDETTGLSAVADRVTTLESSTTPQDIIAPDPYDGNTSYDEGDLVSIKSDNIFTAAMAFSGGVNGYSVDENAIFLTSDDISAPYDTSVGMALLAFSVTPGSTYTISLETKTDSGFTEVSKNNAYVYERRNTALPQNKFYVGTGTPGSTAASGLVVGSWKRTLFANQLTTDSYQTLTNTYTPDANALAAGIEIRIGSGGLGTQLGPPVVRQKYYYRNIKVIETLANGNPGRSFTYDNAMFEARSANSGRSPFLDEYWEHKGLARLSGQEVSAAIQALNTVSTTSDSALARSVQQVSADNATNKAAIEVEASAVAGLEARYAVKANVQGFVTGYGLAVDANNATPLSAFKVQATAFQIQSTGTSADTPFQVRTTATTINGESVPAGVYIKQGFIENGSIVNAKIGDAEIDDAKIAEVSADKINAGTIDVGNVNVEGIGGISVTSTASGSRLEIRNDNIKIFNGSTLRVQIGNLDA